MLVTIICVCMELHCIQCKVSKYKIPNDHQFQKKGYVNFAVQILGLDST